METVNDTSEYMGMVMSQYQAVALITRRETAKLFSALDKTGIDKRGIGTKTNQVEADSRPQRHVSYSQGTYNIK